jgi:hypothetical protein
MRSIGILMTAGLLTLSASAHAQDLGDTCHASSSYDLSVSADALVFDRAAPAPRRIEIRDGRLRIEGAARALNTEDGDRLTLFESGLRALLPRVRQVAVRGVDLAIEALRAETGPLDLGAGTQAELGQRLATHAADLKRRIAASHSTRDWQGDAFERQVDVIVADVVPLIAADLGQQAIDAALGGDLDTAASLRDRATDLATDLQPRLEHRMQVLQPHIEALCPAIRELHALQLGLRGSDGRPLHLLDIDA